MPNLAALRAAIFCYLRKTDGGGTMCPPPAVRRVKKHLILCFGETKMDLKPLIMLF